MLPIHCPPDDDDQENDEQEEADHDRERVVHECAALYGDVRSILRLKNKARYSGFGSFTKKKRAPQLEFAASQIWKQELNSEEGRRTPS